MASNMYYSNGVTQNDYNITTIPNYDSYNLDNQNYAIEANNYSTTTYHEETPQYYNEYNEYIPEASKKIKTILKPRYNTNSVNVNPFLRQNRYLYGIDNIKELMNLSNQQYLSNNSLIDNFNSYNNLKLPVHRPRALSSSTKIPNKHHITYDAIVNDNKTIETNQSPNLQLINKDEVQTFPIEQENNSELINKSSQFQNNPLQFMNKKNPVKKNNIRYSVPLKMNPHFSLKNSLLEDKQDNNSLKVNEIVSKVDDKEYYRKNKSGLVVDYAYYEDPNSENRDYMEDKGRVIENLNNDPNKILFCIFDGHGGVEVSKFLQENLHIYLKKKLPFKHIFEDITQTFKDLDESIKELKLPDVGSTGTIVYIERINGKKYLYCANVGDSRCVLVNRKGIMRMSHDDRVDDKKERDRVIRQGGVIFNGRIYGTLMLTRCFGDWSVKKYGAVVEPHIIKIELNEDDLYLLIASDGVWDVIRDEECRGFTEIYDSTLDTCKNLVKECLNRRSTDNISCLVLKLN